MIFNTLLNWNLLLPIFTYCVVAHSAMVAGSNFDSTLTMTNINTSQMKIQDRTTSICGKRCMSMDITTSDDAINRQLNATQVIQTGFNAVGVVTVVHSQSSVTKALDPYDKVEDTTVTAVIKMTTVPTHTVSDDTQNKTTLFQDNDIDISAGNILSGDIYENSTDVSRLLINSSAGLDLQSNAAQNATVGTGENATIFIAEEDYWEEKFALTLYSRVPPFLIIIGTIGNVVSVVTFQHRHFRHSSTGFILTALSVADIGVLNTYLLPSWLTLAFGIRIKTVTRFTCKIFFASYFYLHDLASWNLILFTVERTLAVWFPFRCKELCSKRRIVISWVIIASILLLPQTFIFLADVLVPATVSLDANNITKVEYVCPTVDEYFDQSVLYVWVIVDATIGDLLPFLVILIGNVLIIVRIRKSHWERKTQMGAAATTSMQMTSSTAKLIGISAMYLICTIPLDIMFFYYFYATVDLLQRKEKAIHDLAYCVGILCFVANNAFEFIVYFVTGRKFRQAFLETFLPCRRKTTKPNVGLQRTNGTRSANTGIASSDV